MGKPKKEELVKYSYWTVTPLQKEFLEAMDEKGNPSEALRAIRKDNYWLMTALSAAKNTPFKRAYSNAVKRLEESYTYSKLRNLSDLDAIRNDLFNRLSNTKDVKEATSIASVLKGIIGEINKMQEGHIAVQRKETVEKKIEFKGTIDLSKPREQNIIDETASSGTIDVDYEDL